MRRTLILLALVALSCLLATGAQADDRDLLQASASEPYTFIITDTSGSMNYSVACTDTVDDIDPWDGACTQPCPINAASCSKMCPFYGCTVDNDAPTTPNEVILDNTTASFTGTWTTATTPVGFEGVDYRHDDNANKGAQRARFNLNVTGSYGVFMRFPPDPALSDAVPIRITHDNGVYSTRIDQTLSGGDWYYIGSFPFSGAGTLDVRTGATTNRVAVDAVRLVEITCARDDFGQLCRQEPCLGDCFPDHGLDGVFSKMFQVRWAMHDVLEEVDNVLFGFATYEQDRVRVAHKHWAYRVREKTVPAAYDPSNPGAFDPLSTVDDPVTGPEQALLSLFDNTRNISYPPPGEIEYFGVAENEGFNCQQGGGTAAERSGCESINVAARAQFAADWTDPYERDRLLVMPKLGRTNTLITTRYVQVAEGFFNFPTVVDFDDTVYRLTYQPVANYDYGEPIFAAQITAARCFTLPSCSVTFPGQTQTIYYDLATDAMLWGALPDPSDPNTFREQPAVSYFNQTSAGISADNSLCNMPSPNGGGLDPNNDTDGSLTGDLFSGYNVRWPNSPADPRGAEYGVGDFVPIDWITDNNTLVRERLAPNTVGGATGIEPDFRTASYFNDDYLPSDNPLFTGFRFLRLKDERQRTLLPDGATPLAQSLRDYKFWFDNWADSADDNDADWLCRRKFVIMLTDGINTCGDDPVLRTAELRDTSRPIDRRIDTYVVGFGLDSEPTLTAMATAGGTTAPLFPRNRDELVDALEQIFSSITPAQATFAAASVPAVQSAASDKIYLASFAAQAGEAFWPGSVDVFREPLPLDSNNRPDTSLDCVGNGLESGCFLYNVRDTLVNQAPNDSDINQDPPVLNLGAALTQRRVFYGQRNLTGAVPGPLRLLDFPSDPVDNLDLQEVWFDASMTATADNQMKKILRELFRIKEGTVQDNNGLDVDVDYVMGDVFHTTPRVVEPPASLDLFSTDLCGPTTASLATPNNCPVLASTTDQEERGYRAYLERNTWRRQMLTVAANDGQLHFFDAGVRLERNDPTVPGRVIEQFSDGTGTELFSYMPRLVMPIVREQVNRDRQVYSVDGPIVVADVVIDPVHNTASPVTPNDREWRTVIVGGLREAGDIFQTSATIPDFVSGYYALDVTQPDELTTNAAGTIVPTPAEQILPSCLNLTGDQLNANSNCQTLAGENITFPAELWTFTDRYEDATIGGPYALDEEDVDSDGVPDGNGKPDLASTWSQPIVGQIPVDEAGTITTKWVAIFGGGVNGPTKQLLDQGSFLYMIDIETGQALYKRELDAPAPADPTGIDLNNDGILDVVYIGTLAGTVYKVDLTEPGTILGTTLAEDNLIGWSTVPGNGTVTVDRITNASWEPYPIFDSDTNLPIYQPITTVFIPEIDSYALAWGDGDREDLWTFPGTEAHYYFILDQEFERGNFDGSGGATVFLPLTDSDFQEFDFDSTLPASASNFILSPVGTNRPGWIMELPDDSRVTTRGFVLSGVLVFTAFEPVINTVDASGNSACEYTGRSLTFVIDARSGTALSPLSQLPSDGDFSAVDPNATLGGDDRFYAQDGFGNAPYVRSGSTTNAPPSGASANPANTLNGNPLLRRLAEQVKRQFFNEGCAFNDSFYQMVEMQTQNTTNLSLLPVPVGVCPADWSSSQATWAGEQ
ncbi:MAG: hypothetical protein AAF772_00895 [Acidobacteriota bacterium]